MSVKCGEVDRVLVALKRLARDDQGWERVWSMLPEGVVWLCWSLQDIEGLGPELALEVALKVAMHGKGGP